tara:strand:+ start:698 stop:871 length:174 start_codon:yes stop_codon:yes gene_type:complete
MKILLSKIACLFGFHDWVYDKETVVKCNRECKKCKKSQHSVYDMGYGETVWSDGKYW